MKFAENDISTCVLKLFTECGDLSEVIGDNVHSLLVIGNDRGVGSHHHQPAVHSYDSWTEPSNKYKHLRTNTNTFKQIKPKIHKSYPFDLSFTREAGLIKKKIEKRLRFV